VEEKKYQDKHKKLKTNIRGKQWKKILVLLDSRKFKRKLNTSQIML
jgi:hypothetical protein